jgi:hypothetical protein
MAGRQIKVCLCEVSSLRTIDDSFTHIGSLIAVESKRNLIFHAITIFFKMTATKAVHF